MVSPHGCESPPGRAARTISVHTNKSALTALQNLNSTNDKLGETQNRINTGLRINNAKENAAVWAIAQGQRADIGALSAVTNSLNRATSIAEVSLTAGATISDLLVELKAKVVSALARRWTSPLETRSTPISRRSCARSPR